MLSLLRQQGIGAVLEDSSGNGGAAVAAYAAAGGMRATIMAPASTSPAKTVQMRAHGAAVELIPGTRQATSDAAVAASDRVFYASHNWQPFFLHGTKTLAYELWEDLGFRAPDNVIVPCGAGSNVLGCQIGFAELLNAGEIETPPRIFAAQPANCGPIAAAFMAGGPVDSPVLPTIAEGTAIASPIRMPEVLGALHETGGGAVMLSEDGDRGRHARSGAAGRVCRADQRPGGGRIGQAAGIRRDHARADDGAGADRHRAEGHAAHRGDAGHRPVSHKIMTPRIFEAIGL